MEVVDVESSQFSRVEKGEFMMTGMLASVRNLEEANIVCEGGADIVDLKEPDYGALGAVPLDMMHRVVDALWEKCLISATTGDLPANASAIEDQVMKTSETGVDYVKVGMFSKQHIENCLPHLASCACKGIAIIAVMFADLDFDMDYAIQTAKQAGLRGIMLDTARKGSGSLLKHKSILQLEYFVNRSRQNGLLIGLAGSLTVEDIPAVIKAGPNYIGFRSALCSSQQRTSYIDKSAFQKVRSSIPILAGQNSASRKI